jgi:hypothetical protein
MSKNITRLACALVLGLSFSFSLFAGTAEFPQYGFQIDTLDGTVGKEPIQAVMMFLPVTESFAPNVNVQIQPYGSTMKDYIALSKKQFEEMKLKFISEHQVSNNEWTIEYSGQMQNLPLHWYARALLNNQKIYLVTATATDTQWPKVSHQLRENVNSFKVKP